MTERALEAYYVIVGAGAVAMAFADTLLTDTEASIIIVDLHHLLSPGAPVKTLTLDFGDVKTS